MRSQVEIKMTSLLKSSTTNVTLERLYISVRPHVLTKVYRLRERLGAYYAFERLHFRVSAKMLIQPSFLSKSFWTKCASVWANACMHPHVLLQAALLRKALGADRALVRFCLGVYYHVMLVILSTV